MQGGQQTGTQGRSFPPVITICNYNVYPFARPVEGAANEPLGAIKGPAMGQQTGHQSDRQTSMQVIENKDVLKLPTPKRAGIGPANGPKKKKLKKKKERPRRVRRLVFALSTEEIPSGSAESIHQGGPFPDSPSCPDGKNQGVRRELGSKPEAERKYIPYPASWLNAGSYDDEPEGGARPTPVVRDPRSYTDADWQKRLDHLRDCETWFEDRWGPRPGEPGSLVPSRLLIAPASKSKGVA